MNREMRVGVLRGLDFWGILALIVAFLLVLPRIAQAQGTASASLNGTITDSSGATVPDATVKLTNTRESMAFTTQTASDGGYRFVDVPPGPAYSLTVTKEGFETLVLNNIYLPTATSTTKDGRLEIGSVSQTVEVTAEGGSVSLNTTDATIGNNIDMHAVESLPNEFRDDPGNLLRIQAGVTTAQANGSNVIASNIDANATRDGSVAGARADQNNITIDGVDASNVYIGQAFNTQAAVPVDAIQEFSTQIAQPSAAYGGRSGAQTVIATKSGTNDWHGAAYEYNRTAATEANTFFNNQADVPRLALVRNQFGTNLGGPVLKNKLFFFFEYDGRRDAKQDSELQIVPFPHVAQGEIAYINNNAGCSDSSRLTSADVSTNCVTILPAAQVKALDPCSTAACSSPGFVQAGPAPVLLGLFQNRYPKPNDFTVGDGINTAGLRFNAPAPLTENGYLTRIDYNLSPNNKLFGRFNIRNQQTVNDNNAQVLPIQFPGDPLTALETIRDRAWAIGDTWTINSSLINQFTYGETRANHQLPIVFNPGGGLYELSFFGAFQGDTFATPFDRQTSSGDVVPDPTFRDDVTWIHGKHTFQFGAQFNPIKIRSSLVNDIAFIQEGEGGAITGLTPTFRPSNILNDQTANSNWDNFFLGDLGLIWNYSADVLYTHNGTQLPAGSTSRRDWRLYDVAAYAEDAWRVRNDLTISLGLRYQFQSTPYDVHGNEAQFYNTDLNQLVADRIANGLAGVSGPTATPLLTYQLAGAGNPGGKPLFPPDKLDFSPRLALAWNPSFREGLLGKAFGDRKTVLRAGAGLIYDESVIYAVTNIEDQGNYVFSEQVAQQFNTGNTSLANILETDPRMNSASATPFPIVAPSFQSPLTPAFNTFNYGIDPHLHMPYSITASLGLQRELPGGFQLETDYFGRFGRRLMLLGDASQAINFVDPSSKESLVQAFTVLEQASRQNGGAGAPSVPNQPFFENQMSAALGQSCQSVIGTSCTTFVYDNNLAALQNGATGEIVASLPLPPNVGLTPQFFVDALMANKGFSDYNALFVTLRKRLSNNLQFDFNYTFSHSLDNGSTVGNENGNFEPGDTSVMCDVTNNRACRGNSEFDLTHQIAAEFVYGLPFGRGQALGRNVNRWVNEAIGDWSVSGIETWHTGFAYTANNTDIALFDTVSLAADTGELFTGSRGPLAEHIHIDPTANNSVQFYANPTLAAAQFSPVTGLQSGDRDTLRGPHFSNLDLAVSKNFPLWVERYRLQFRAEAYNVFNHPNFGLPDTGVTSGRFGIISGLVGQEPSRVMQFALRFDF